MGLKKVITTLIYVDYIKPDSVPGNILFGTLLQCPWPQSIAKLVYLWTKV